MNGLNGLLLVDKPGGLTSHDVVARLRKLSGLKRIGHTGTLDPMATGLLTVLLGPATRLAPWLSGLDKDYEATVRLGLSTDTGDLTGAVTGEHPGPWPASPLVEAALKDLEGPQEQRPPAFSAIKVGGRKAYEAARAGRPLALTPRRVTAHELRLVNYKPPFASIYAKVSSGYYVRSLAVVLGEALALDGGALSALRRVRMATWSVEEATALAAIAAWGPLDWTKILTPAAALPHLPEFRLNEEAARRFRQGRVLAAEADFRGPRGESAPPGPHKVLGPEGELLGLGEFSAASLGGGPPLGPFLRPLRVMA